MQRWILGLLAVLLLVGCGKSSSASAAPETLHANWIEAMKTNQRETLVGMMAEIPMKARYVDDSLRQMNDRLRNQPKGPLLGVDVLPLLEDPEGKRGVSVWKWEQLTECYRLILTATDAGWQVTSWGLMLRCPKNVQAREVP